MGVVGTGSSEVQVSGRLQMLPKGDSLQNVLAVKALIDCKVDLGAAAAAVFVHLAVG